MNRYFKTCLAGLAALALSFSALDAATELYRKKGEQFFDSSGDPLAGGKVYYYEAGTTNLQTTYSDAAGSTANSNPIVLDAAGRLTVPVYFGDSDSFSDYKEDLNTSADVAVSPWPFDDIPAAEPADSAAAFAPPLLSWSQVVSGASPVALTASDAGNAYEADTTSGNIEFDLPSAASVGDGKGFFFKKTVAGNSMIIDQSGSETIDNSATALTITSINTVVGIFSNGAEWYRVDGYLDAVQLGPLLPGFQSMQVFTASGTYTLPSGIERALVIVTGAGGGGGGADCGDTTCATTGGGGGAGGTGIELLSAATIGASQTITIGSGGTAGADTGGDGGNGGNTTFGALLSGAGGNGGIGNSTSSSTTGSIGGSGGSASGGDINLDGGAGSGGAAFSGDTEDTGHGGIGGGSWWGGGANGGSVDGAQSQDAGDTGSTCGVGGGGAVSIDVTTGAAGGVGANGCVWVLEFGS